jgi:hypothetical protein
LAFSCEKISRFWDFFFPLGESKCHKSDQQKQRQELIFPIHYIHISSPSIN